MQWCCESYRKDVVFDGATAGGNDPCGRRSDITWWGRNRCLLGGCGFKGT